MVSLYMEVTSLWYAFGPQGETRQLTDSTGTVVDSYIYSAYGLGLSHTGTDVNPFQYGGQAGYYTDACETGIILCGARWYDPYIGRWLSRDPIEYDGGANLFGYCNEDPVNLIDQDGLGPKKHAVVFIGDIHGSWYNQWAVNNGVWRDKRALRSRFQRAGYVVDFVENATKLDVSKRMRNADAVAFIAHNNGAGSIALSRDDEGNLEYIDPDDIRMILHGRHLDLAIVHACYSDSDDLRSAFVGNDKAHYEGVKGLWNPVFGIDTGKYGIVTGIKRGGKKRTSIWQKWAPLPGH